MQDISDVTLGEGIVTKRFAVWCEAGRLLFENAKRFVPMLADLDLGPKVVVITNNAIITEREIPLSVLLSLAPEENRIFGEKVYAALTALHAAGIAHRDAQIPNLLLSAADRIHLCDTEFAMAVDPKTQKAYDLHGPKVTGILPPDPHEYMKIAAYWDSTSVDDPPHKWFGPLKEYM